MAENRHLFEHHHDRLIFLNGIYYLYRLITANIMKPKAAPKSVVKMPTATKLITKPIKVPAKKAPSPIAIPKTPAILPSPLKQKKTKLVRDSFTIPKDEFAALQKLKERAVLLAKPAKKGELLRAGLLALSSMSDALFLSSLSAVTTLKTGRPKGIKNNKK